MHPYGAKLKSHSEAMPLGWYAVYTRHQHEKSAAQFLSNKGYDVLLPLYESRRQWKDRLQVVLLPLFSSYLFVHADLDRRIDVLRTPGVCWLVCNAGVPAALADNEIADLRRLTENPGNLQPHVFLNCGDRVRVAKGPLAGLEGILVREKNNHRVVLSVELLQQSASVEVDLASLEPAVPAPKPSAIQFIDSRCFA